MIYTKCILKNSTILMHENICDRLTVWWPCLRNLGFGPQLWQRNWEMRADWNVLLVSHHISLCRNPYLWTVRWRFVFGQGLIPPIAHMEMLLCSCTEAPFGTQCTMTMDDSLLNFRKNKALNNIPEHLVVTKLLCSVFVQVCGKEKNSLWWKKL